MENVARRLVFSALCGGESASRAALVSRSFYVLAHVRRAASPLGAMRRYGRVRVPP